MDSSLWAGAAKTDLSPSSDLFPLPQREMKFYDHVYEPIYVRVAAFRQDEQLFFLLSFELFGSPFADELRKLLAQKYQIPESHIWICDTYNHCAPREDLYRFDTSTCGSGAGNRTNQYFSRCVQAALETAEVAYSQLFPCYVRICTGESPVCMNRDKALGTDWILGKNPEGMHDWNYFRFEIVRKEDDVPCIQLIQYSLYGNMCYLADHDSSHTLGTNGDFPGRVCGILESIYKESTVLWLCGAAGNQDPLFLSSYSIWENETTRKPAFLKESQIMTMRECQAQWLVGDLLHPPKTVAITKPDSIRCLFHEVPMSVRERCELMLNVQLCLVHAESIWFLFMSGAPTCEMGNEIRRCFENDTAILITHAGMHTGYIVCQDEPSLTFESKSMLLTRGAFETQVLPVIVQMKKELS